MPAYNAEARSAVRRSELRSVAEGRWAKDEVGQTVCVGTRAQVVCVDALLKSVRHVIPRIYTPFASSTRPVCTGATVACPMRRTPSVIR